MSDAFDRTISVHGASPTSRIELTLEACERKLRRDPHCADAQERKRALLQILSSRRPLRLGIRRASRRAARLCAAWRPMVEEICRRHGVTVADLLSGYKDDRLIPPRHEIWWTLHKIRGVSLPEIGRRFGGYHHTSVLHGVRMWQKRLDEKAAA